MLNKKPKSMRQYDEEGFRRRAACVCVRSDTESEILLVTSSRNSDQWIVPGGGVEACETSSTTAVREALEEAGVEGKLQRCLGVFENTEQSHRTEVYVMLVTKELDEWDDSRSINRKRRWFSFNDALAELELHKPNQLHYLTSLKPSLCESSNLTSEYITNVGRTNIEDVINNKKV